MVLIGHDFISKHYGYQEVEEFVKKFSSDS